MGDLLAQLTVDADKPFDWKRLGIFTFLGVALVGPALHAWYGVLGRLVTSTGSKGESCGCVPGCWREGGSSFTSREGSGAVSCRRHLPP